METRELLGGMEENSVSPKRGHLFAKSMIFYKKEIEKNELMARPVPQQRDDPRLVGPLQDTIQLLHRHPVDQ